MDDIAKIKAKYFRHCSFDSHFKKEWIDLGTISLNGQRWKKCITFWNYGKRLIEFNNNIIIECQNSTKDIDFIRDCYG